jgi:hypothetical protein
MSAATVDGVPLPSPIAIMLGMQDGSYAEAIQCSHMQAEEQLGARGGGGATALGRRARSGLAAAVGLHQMPRWVPRGWG